MVAVPLTDSPGHFGVGTATMVQEFQRTRGLPITGDVDATTWSSLVEAGWLLGRRLLFLATPFLRGDDVAELQIRLAQLGFNPGRIDGIFGTVLEGALREFQRNLGLEASGTLTRATLLDLLRMTSIASNRSLVTEARDGAGFDAEIAGPLVVCGAGALVELVAQSMDKDFDVHVVREASPEEVAHFANECRATLVLSFNALKDLNGVHVHYWASYDSHSRRGDRLGGLIAAQLAQSVTIPRVEVTGMALPILRETQMTTLHIEHGNPSDQVLREMAREIARVVATVFHRAS